jgi:hypothetical protein
VPLSHTPVVLSAAQVVPGVDDDDVVVSARAAITRFGIAKSRTEFTILPNGSGSAVGTRGPSR